MSRKSITKIVITVLLTKLVIAVLVGGGLALYFKDDIKSFWDAIHIKVAEYQPPKKTVWLDQNISKEKLSWFYHADQGTRTFGIPYEWFMALEQPAIHAPFASVGLFSDPAYLDRYGFIPDVIEGKPGGAPYRLRTGHRSRDA